MTPSQKQIAMLPGGELILQGLEDLQNQRTTIPACLVAIVHGKVRQAGLVTGNAPLAEPEFVLYDLLRKDGGNAYGRYNSLIRELVSFGRALAHLTKA